MALFVNGNDAEAPLKRGVEAPRAHAACYLRS